MPDPSRAGARSTGPAFALLVVIPFLRPAHILELPRNFMHAGLLYAIPMAAVAGASAFGWMLAYLRGPDLVSDWIELHAGTDPRMILFLLVLLFVIVGDFIDAVPAIIIFMPIVTRLAELGDINSVHMGVVIITTLVFGLITPPYGLPLLYGEQVLRREVHDRMDALLPLYLVFFATIAFCIFFRTWSSGSRSRSCRSRSAASRRPAARATSVPDLAPLLQPDSMVVLVPDGPGWQRRRDQRC